MLPLSPPSLHVICWPVMWGMGVMGCGMAGMGWGGEGQHEHSSLCLATIWPERVCAGVFVCLCACGGG